MFRILETMGRVRAIVFPTRSDRDRAELDQLRVQLAGCGVAALGGTDPQHVAKQGDFGWSPAYQDVLVLRRQHDEWRPFLIELAKMWSRCDCHPGLPLPVTDPGYRPCIHERAHLLIIKPRGSR